jgi:hypothetical protein
VNIIKQTKTGGKTMKKLVATIMAVALRAGIAVAGRQD